MTQLKDIKDISIDDIIIPENKDIFIKNNDVKIIGAERVGNDKLKLLLEDEQKHKGFIYINALNNQGSSILDGIESMLKFIRVPVPLCVLSKLDPENFKPEYY